MSTVALKLKTLLALTQNGKAMMKNFLGDYIKFFQKEQSQFLGRKNTYDAKPDTVDEPNRRSYVKVVTTVDEKIKYLKSTLSGYVKQVMDQEATNASGSAKASLIVGEENWGEYSSGELLRLKSLVENGEFKQMITLIPVRSDAESWDKSDAEEYRNRNIYEKPVVRSVNKTITKQQYILKDPNITPENAARYTPVTATKDTVVELGDITTQEFSGAWSHHQRANTQKRVEELRSAIIKALEKANDVDVIESQLPQNKLFDFIFGE